MVKKARQPFFKIPYPTPSIYEGLIPNTQSPPQISFPSTVHYEGQNINIFISGETKPQSLGPRRQVVSVPLFCPWQIETEVPSLSALVLKASTRPHSFHARLDSHGSASLLGTDALCGKLLIYSKELHRVEARLQQCIIFCSCFVSMEGALPLRYTSWLQSSISNSLSEIQTFVLWVSNFEFEENKRSQ